jgi:hypothetical protein
LGPGGRTFKSCRPDLFPIESKTVFAISDKTDSTEVHKLNLSECVSLTSVQVVSRSHLSPDVHRENGPVKPGLKLGEVWRLPVRRLAAQG